MKDKSPLENIREYENMHIALWLLKDTCWVMSFKVGGMLMIIPTIAVAVHLTWKSRKSVSDLFHNTAVCLWITANAIWMTGEFFYNDGFRPYSTVLFLLGLIVVATYYLVYFPKRNAVSVEKEEPAQHNTIEAAYPEAANREAERLVA